MSMIAVVAMVAIVAMGLNWRVRIGFASSECAEVSPLDTEVGKM
jgi:hypothetical protein